MTIENAVIFIRRGLRDPDLRNRLNEAVTPLDCIRILEEEQLRFSDDEFNSAFNQLLTQCKEEEDSEILREFKLYWNILIKSASLHTCQAGCTHCSP